MRKDESIQVHALLRAMKQHVEIEYGIDAEAFEEYDELVVQPEHVFAKKGKHQEALMLLAEKIADALAKSGSYSSDEDKEKREPIPA
ncbi:UPF0058 family protein [Halococcus salifodinae]|uniref:Metal-binding protein n=1 Tax=Halococcus salifodinae DSM 8989 TaxID=1227456 RepID=M0NB28_9EURY|nr:UPF0058 family protein [Halococcus salifodinae]EMA54778.1 hypothetical protein C450_04918 [Halococcus salifodinae DSM 8989]